MLFQLLILKFRILKLKILTLKTYRVSFPGRRRRTSQIGFFFLYVAKNIAFFVHDFFSEIRDTKLVLRNAKMFS